VLARFFAALKAQRYPAFRILVAVEDAEEPALAVLARASFRAPVTVATVVAGRATAEGQKVHNLRAAVAATTAADEILVFCDADIIPAPDWLERLVRPLVRRGADAVSGFPWLSPERRSLPNLLAATLSASIVTLPRTGPFNAAWGGTLAIRRERFLELGIDRAWEGAISDDLQFTRALRAGGGRLLSPRELVPVAPVDYDWPGLLAIGRRWHALFWRHLPRKAAAACAALFVAAAGWATVITATIAGSPAAAALLACGFALALVRGHLCGRIVARLRSVDVPIGAWHGTLVDAAIAPLAASAQLVMASLGLLTRRFVWAGITYAVAGPQDVRVLPPAERLPFRYRGLRRRRKRLAPE